MLGRRKRTEELIPNLHERAAKRGCRGVPHDGGLGVSPSFLSFFLHSFQREVVLHAEVLTM